MNNFFQGTNGTLTTAGLVLSGTDLGISFNQFTNLSRGIVLLGDDPDLGTNAGPAINATVMRNRFCDVATNVVVEPLVTGTAESGSLTCPWPPPSLTIAPAVMLSWPDYAIGWTLEAATNLQGPWTQVAMVPSLVGGDYVLALKTDTQKGFFRLRAP
jgi:hypothetical protein